MSWVPSDYFMEQLLLEASECESSAPFSGVLCGVYVGLAIAPVPGLNRKTILSQFVEASFPGYARLPITWRLPYFGSNGLWNLEGVCGHWQPTGSDAGQLMNAVFIASAISGGQLLLSDVFPSPGIDLSSPEEALTIVIRFGLDPLGKWGDYTVVD